MATMTVALAGNPNCGKSTIFNNLTGARQHIGNYPGVTVEKREGYVEHCGKKLLVCDLPGTYNLTARSPDELAARKFIIEEKPDAVVNIVDAGNLERNLYLTLQLLELESPMVLTLNMADALEKSRISLDDAGLAAKLGVAVVRTVGNKNRGTENLLDAVLQAKKSSVKLPYDPELERWISVLSAEIEKSGTKKVFPQRWLAIKLLEDDKEVKAFIVALKNGEMIKALAKACREKIEIEFNETAENLIAQTRYHYAAELCRSFSSGGGDCEITFSDRIDRVLTNRFLGLPIFFAFIWLLFNLVFALGEYPKALLEEGFILLGKMLGNSLPEGELRSLLVDGVIGGVGGVLVFLPDIMLLFLGISLLEDSGYMARAAFVMDRIMRYCGLHGKSFIPMLLGFGCGVPAALGTRTIENRNDRMVTLLVTPFMSCSARLPVYAVLIAAFFPEDHAGTVLFSIYLLGIGLAVLMAKVFRNTLFKGEEEPFVMELPPYRAPSPKNVLLQMWGRGVLYLRKAGTIILAASILVWFMLNYPQQNEAGKLPEKEMLRFVHIQAQVESGKLNEGFVLDDEKARASEKLRQSYAGQLGYALQPLLEPLGFDWKIGIALFAAFSAKEVLVSTLGTIYSVGESGLSLEGALAADPSFNMLKAYSLMSFVLLYSPCMAVLAVIKRETASWRWPLFSIFYSTILACLVSFLIYQGGILLGY